MSPIPELTDKKRLPRLGKIRLGIKMTKDVGDQKVEYPSAVDYFVFDKDNPLYDKLVEVYGSEPKTLRIRIPVEDEEKWASTYYRAYSRTRGLLCKGDGETAVCMVDTKTGEMASKDSKETVMKTVTCRGRDCPAYKNICRPVMNLQFMLPEIPGLGIWQVDTSSINSIRNIYGEAELIKGIYGRISLLPLMLTIEPQEVQDSEGKKRKVNVLNLRTNQTLIEMASMASRSNLLTAGEEELPVPDDEVPEMIIPQNQEERVTAEAQAAQKNAGKKDAGATTKKTRKATAAEGEKGTGQENTGQQATGAQQTGVQGPPPDDLEKSLFGTGEAATAPPDPPATRDEKREIIAAFRKQGLTDDQIRKKFWTVTRKQHDWLRSDMDKLREEAKKGVKSPEEEADELLKSIGE